MPMTIAQVVEEVAPWIFSGFFVLAVAVFFGLGSIGSAFDDIDSRLSDIADEFKRWVDIQQDKHAAEFGPFEDEDPDPGFDAIETDDYPDPTEEQLRSPRFEAVWRAIKGWDISRDGGTEGYHGPTGNDVMHILNALDANPIDISIAGQLSRSIERNSRLVTAANTLLVELDKASQAAGEYPNVEIGSAIVKLREQISGRDL